MRRATRLFHIVFLPVSRIDSLPDKCELFQNSTPSRLFFFVILLESCPGFRRVCCPAVRSVARSSSRGRRRPLSKAAPRAWESHARPESCKAKASANCERKERCQPNPAKRRGRRKRDKCFFRIRATSRKRVVDRPMF